METFREGAPQTLHRLLGPRTAYLIGSRNDDGSDHLCAASNVTNVGNATQLVALALWPKWTSTRNIQGRGEFTINLMDAADIESIWIVGYRYTKVAIPAGTSKFTAAGLGKQESVAVQPAGVREALAILECKVVRVLDDVGDHVVFIGEMLRGVARGGYFDSSDVLDTAKGHPAMQNSGRQFAQAVVAATPDTEWCSKLVESHVAGQR